MIPEALARYMVPGTDPDVAASYAALGERASDETFGFEDEIAIVDVETTGWDPDRDALIEVAAAVMRGPLVVDRFSTLVDPGRPVPAEITALTGIDSEMLAGAPDPCTAADRLAEFVGGRDIVAHNASFDRGFLVRAAGAHAFPGAWLDSLVLARIGLPRMRSHRLADLAEAFGAPEGRAHRAGDDVDALAFVWRVVQCALSDLPVELLARIGALAPGAQWPERSVIAHHAAAAPHGSAYDLRRSRLARTSAESAEALANADEVTCTCPPVDEVLAQFEAEGLAGRMYSGFEKRDEQVQMAEAVLDAFAQRRFAAIEAGTGVGKSVAYLVPAALFAQGNGVGVGVATKTNALMDQLVYHELPKLCAALDEPLRYVSLKGYDHYLCLRKLERAVAELGDESDADKVGVLAMLLAWTAQTSFGDLDQVNVHWRGDIRSAISSSQADCTKKRCRYFPALCYLHGVRRRAQAAHIVVTNHALLFRDVVAQGAVLPPLRHWIVDEAHAAESEARRQLCMQASHFELSAALGALSGRRKGLLENLRRRLGAMDANDPLATTISRLEEESTRAATLADSMFDFVKDLAELAGDSSYDSCDLRISAEVRETGKWGPVDSTGRSLARRLDAIMQLGRELVTRMEEAGAETSDVRADLAGLLSRLADQLEGLVAVLDGEDGGLVYSASLDRRRNVTVERLEAAHVDVGAVLAEEFYPRAHSVVYTSATIATGTSFEHFALGVGLDRLAEERISYLRLTSSYDFERQMAVFVPDDMPEPRARGYADALEELLYGVHVAMCGSVLTLFTNRRDLEDLYQRLEPRLQDAGLALIRQHRGTSAKRLRDEFIGDESLSLFALKSFWEGFDAKGDTLRCVVVPKLPFGRPSDPLSQEREAREGREAWGRYVLPEAVIELKQAAGRLIRSRTDVGCLVIADARVIGKFYGRRFLEALPVADVEIMPAEKVVAEVGRRFAPSGAVR